MELDKDLASVQEVRNLVATAQKAQAELARLDQGQIDRVVLAMTEAAEKSAELLAKMAASEISQVESDYAVGGSKFKAWLNGRVKGGSRLSNVDVTPTFVRSATTTTLLVTLRIEWKMPGATTGSDSREVKGVYETTTLLF